MSPRIALGALALTVLATPWLGAVPARASGGGSEVVQRGACTGTATWKLKGRPDNGRIELEAEVDSNRSGQVWHWRLVHDGTLSAAGTATTSGASGSFEVRRRMSDLAGTDRFRFRAVHRASGQVCRGTIVL